jgi:type II secretory pathway pseudopilin PulG
MFHQLAGSTTLRRRASGQRGYALVEVLLATAIAGALLGVLLQFTLAVQTTVGVQGEVAGLQQRLRLSVEAVRRDLAQAGAGPSRGTGRGPLTRVLPPIVPARLGLVGADPDLSFFDDRVTIMYVPETRAETAVVAPMVDAASPLAIDGNAAGCPPARACDFSAGDRALVFEPGGAGSPYETFTIAAVDAVGNRLTPAAALSRAYPAGSRVVAIVQRVFHFDRAGKRLMVYDGARSDLPIADHVVDLRFTYLADPRPNAVAAPAPGLMSCAYAGDPPIPLLANLGGMAPKPLTAAQLTDGPICGPVRNRFDADLLRIRRVVFTIRLEAESAEFRGTGSGFSTPGFARASTKRVADQQATVAVAPRNMGRSW